MTMHCAVLAASVAARALAAQQADVIRGRIIGPDSTPIERATVTVTLLVPLTAGELEALELETAAFGRFLGVPAELRVAQG